MGDSGEDQDAMPEGGGVKTMFTVAVLQTQLQDLEVSSGGRRPHVGEHGT